MISKELLSEVLGFEFIQATGKELLEHSFGYEQGLRTSCIRPLKDDEWICVHNNELTFGFKDIRTEVLKNIPDGVYTSRTINIYELAHKCKEWAWNNRILLISSQCGNSFNEIPSYVVKLSNNGLITAFDEFPQTEPEAIFKACQWILDQSKNTKE